MERFRCEWASSEPFTARLEGIQPVGNLCRAKLEVLLSEISDRTVARLAFEFPGTQMELWKSREEARIKHGVSTSPVRYLPRKVCDLAHGPPLPWAQFASLGRCGSWLEVLSLQGPISVQLWPWKLSLRKIASLQVHLRQPWGSILFTSGASAQIALIWSHVLGPEDRLLRRLSGMRHHLSGLSPESCTRPIITDTYLFENLALPRGSCPGAGSGPDHASIHHRILEVK